MIEIIPSINAPTFEEAEEKIKKVEPFVKWCHLDVTDGIFSKHLTWHNPLDLPRFNTKLNAEAHLMIEKPEEAIENWLASPVKRIIVQLEAVNDLDLIVNKCRKAKIEIGLSINPETFWGKLTPWFGKVDLIQILAVHPGLSGQAIQEDALEKVKKVRETCPGCKIEFDGGVNLETAEKIIESGADILVAGSAIFSAPDIGLAIRRLFGE